MGKVDGPVTKTLKTIRPLFMLALAATACSSDDDSTSDAGTATGSNAGGDSSGSGGTGAGGNGDVGNPDLAGLIQRLGDGVGQRCPSACAALAECLNTACDTGFETVECEETCFAAGNPTTALPAGATCEDAAAALTVDDFSAICSTLSTGGGGGGGSGGGGGGGGLDAICCSKLECSQTCGAADFACTNECQQAICGDDWSACEGCEAWEDENPDETNRCLGLGG